MRRLLHSSWARSLAILGVYLLSLQSMGLSRIALASEADDCCCHARNAACHCPICSHARALESGQPFFQGCGSGSAPVLGVVVLDPSLPAAAPEPAAKVAVAVPGAPPARLLQDPPREVPTPPPLA